MFTAFMLIGWTLAGQSPASANEELKLEVNHLMRQLDSDELQQRDAAEEALIQKGSAALKLLPTAADRMSAEVRERLARVRKKIEDSAALSIVKPTLISLDSDAMPLSKVLASFEEQSGNKIIDFRPDFRQPITDPILKVHFDKVPFWQAFDQVLDQAGLTVYPYTEKSGLHIIGRAEGRVLRATNGVYSGPFRFEPLRLVAQREFNDREKASSLRLLIEVTWEPRINPIILRQRLADVSAVDDRGQPIKMQYGDAQFEVPVDWVKSAVELSLPFASPPREAGAIALLKGKTTTTIAGLIKEFRFGDLMKAKNVEQRQSGATVTLEQVRQNKDAWEVFVRIRFDRPGDALASHRGWIFRNEAFLEDSAGKRIDYKSYETTRQTADELGIAYSFILEKPPADMKFVYKTACTIVEGAFDYEIHDLKLP